MSENNRAAERIYEDQLRAEEKARDLMEKFKEELKKDLFERNRQQICQELVEKQVFRQTGPSLKDQIKDSTDYSVKR